MQNRTTNKLYIVLQLSESMTLDDAIKVSSHLLIDTEHDDGRHLVKIDPSNLARVEVRELSHYSGDNLVLSPVEANLNKEQPERDGGGSGALNWDPDDRPRPKSAMEMSNTELADRINGRPFYAADLAEAASRLRRKDTVSPQIHSEVVIQNREDAANMTNQRLGGGAWGLLRGRPTSLHTHPPSGKAPPPRDAPADPFRACGCLRRNSARWRCGRRRESSWHPGRGREVGHLVAKARASSLHHRQAQALTVRTIQRNSDATLRENMTKKKPTWLDKMKTKNHRTAAAKYYKAMGVPIPKTNYQYERVVEAVKKHPGKTATQIARITDLPPANVSTILRRLAPSGCFDVTPGAGPRKGTTYRWAAKVPKTRRRHALAAVELLNVARVLVARASRDLEANDVVPGSLWGFTRVVNDLLSLSGDLRKVK